MHAILGQASDRDGDCLKILAVDDDPDLLALVAFALTNTGYAVVKAADTGAAIRVFEAELPNLVILDINLPSGSGFDVCRAIRGRSDVPIMMLTVRGEEEDLVRALELGADDYLTKPFSPRTLLARVKALLRRAGIEAGDTLSAGSVSLDLEAHTIAIAGGAPLRLTRLETRLLQILVAQAGHVVSAERLLAHVWGHRGSGDRQLLKQLVHRLRHKLEREPAGSDLLQTESGVGYRLKA
jgi:DNA-binding response OmpR family regulator